jgi:hypothetical protein
MVGSCGLAPDINKCPNYNVDTANCTINNNACGFFKESAENNEERNEYKRKPRWYEQYYNR